MKSPLYLLHSLGISLVLSFTFYFGMAQNVNIPDVSFKAILLSNAAINTDGNGAISIAEAAAFTDTIDVSSAGITDLTGIEAFTALRGLICRYNHNLTTLDVSTNTALRHLDCFSGRLTSLNLSNNASITFLNCSFNQYLTNLDVSVCTALTSLSCNSNQLFSLDVSANSAFKKLDCSSNQLTSLNLKNGNNLNLSTSPLDARNNPNLTCIQVDNVTWAEVQNYLTDSIASFSLNCTPYVYIPDANFKAALVGNTSVNTDADGEISITEAAAYTNTLAVAGLNIADLTGIEAFTSLQMLNCSNNQISSLDVSANAALSTLDCRANQLTQLNVKNGNNIHLTSFTATSNPGLSCINVDDAVWASANWTSIDNGVGFSEECGGPFVYIPDISFKLALLHNSNINTVQDEEISFAEAAAFTDTLGVKNLQITDLTGIEAFTAITALRCNSNRLTSLNVSSNTALTYLNCSTNLLDSIDVSGNTALNYLNCEYNELTSIDLSANTALTYLRCYSNNLTILNIATNTGLTYLSCSHNQLTNLDVSANTALTYLGCTYNQLTSLDVLANTALVYLYCYNNAISFLDVSASTALVTLNCTRNQLTNLNTSTNTELTTLICDFNQLPSLDVSASTSLTNLVCSSNQLSNLDISANTNLLNLNCRINALTALDVSAITALKTLDCITNQIATLDVSHNSALTNLQCHYNQLTSLNIKNGNNTNLNLYAGYNPNLTCVQVDDEIWANAHWADRIDAIATFSEDCGPYVYIPDTNFKTSLLANIIINTVDDGEISFTEAAAYTDTIDVHSLDIADLTGLEAFVNIIGLQCSDNNLDSLNVSANLAIKYLACSQNQLTYLNVSTNAALTYLNCTYNSLTILDVSNCAFLKILGCNYNNLASLSVSNNTNLEYLTCSFNDIEALNVSANTNLLGISCSFNQLQNLDVSTNTNLINLDLANNQLHELNISSNTALEPIAS